MEKAINVTCPSCGAEFDSSKEKCPYCETLYEPGAEKAYMDRLDEIRRDMDDLKSLTVSETKEELKYMVKKIIIGVGIAVAVVILLLLAFLIV